MQSNDSARRVVFISPSWPSGYRANGIVTYIQYVREGFQALGIESRVATYNRGPGGEEAVDINGSFSRSNRLASFATRASWKLFPGITSRVVPRLDVQRSLRQLERDWPFDLLETEESFGVAKWISRTVKAPVVVRLHGPWCVNGPALGVQKDAAYQARLSAEGRAISTAFAVSAPSRDVLDQVRRYYNLPLHKAVVIPNPGPEPQESQKWDIANKDSNRLVYIGRFDRHKGGDIAIEAFVNLAQRHRTLTLTFAGPDNGLVDDSGTRWSIRQFIEAKVPEEYRSRIDFVGHQSQAALISLRQRAKVVICASRYENFPMAILEAMSQGCPIVCPDAGGIPEMIQDGESGLLFRAGDASSLAKCLEVLIREPSRTVDLGAGALRTYQGRYLPQRVASQTLEFYQEVCAKYAKKSLVG